MKNLLLTLIVLFTLYSCENKPSTLVLKYRAEADSMSKVRQSEDSINEIKKTEIKKTMNFKVISESHFINGRGATNNYFTIGLNKFDSNNKIAWNVIEDYAIVQSVCAEKNGLTIIFIFDSEKNTPKINGKELGWPDKFDKHCLYGYWVYPTGLKEGKKFPMN